LVGEEELEWANGALGVGFNIGSLVGPILGGALYVAAGRSIVFAVDAGTFLFAAATVFSIRIPFSAPTVPDPEVDEERRGLLRGFRLVFADPTLRALLVIWAAGYFAVDIVLVAELPLARALGAGALVRDHGGSVGRRLDHRQSRGPEAPEGSGRRWLCWGGSSPWPVPSRTWRATH
jgi:MFS family permease